MQIDREREPSDRSPFKHGESFPIPGRLPVFPLPNVVFFPKTYLPLHIFEPRYRRMVADATMGGQCIAMALLKEGMGAGLRWESGDLSRALYRADRERATLAGRSLQYFAARA